MMMVMALIVAVNYYRIDSLRLLVCRHRLLAQHKLHCTTPQSDDAVNKRAPAESIRHWAIEKIQLFCPHSELTVWCSMEEKKLHTWAWHSQIETESERATKREYEQVKYTQKPRARWEVYEWNSSTILLMFTSWYRLLEAHFWFHTAENDIDDCWLFIVITWICIYCMAKTHSQTASRTHQ